MTSCNGRMTLYNGRMTSCNGKTTLYNDKMTSYNGKMTSYNGKMTSCTYYQILKAAMAFHTATIALIMKVIAHRNHCSLVSTSVLKDQRTLR